MVSTLLKNPPENWKLEENSYNFILKWAAASLYGGIVIPNLSVVHASDTLFAAGTESVSNAQNWRELWFFGVLTIFIVCIRSHHVHGYDGSLA